MAKKRRTKVDELKAFGVFIVANGGELLTPTNPYEVVRFRGNGITSIIYENTKGNRKYVGQAQQVWIAFNANTPFRLAKATAKINGYKLKPLDLAIAERDGQVCFYCGLPFDLGGRRARTREHLVAATHGGPNHISNLFHACAECNGKAGHLSAPEKIKLRDQMRAKPGDTECPTKTSIPAP